jgi:hypothetical protein
MTLGYPTHWRLSSANQLKLTGASLKAYLERGACPTQRHLSPENQMTLAYPTHWRLSSAHQLKLTGASCKAYLELAQHDDV